MKSNSGIGVVEVIIIIAILVAIASIATVASAQTTPSVGISTSPIFSTEQYQTTDDQIDGPDVTEEQIDLLARLITAEEGYATSHEIGTEAYNNILECYALCGGVVINRIASDEFPDTLEEVIYQPGQYAVVDSGAIEKPYDDIAWEIAEELLVYGTEIPDDVVFQAQFMQGSSLYRQVGNQLFCRR